MHNLDGFQERLEAPADPGLDIWIAEVVMDEEGGAGTDPEVLCAVAVRSFFLRAVLVFVFKDFLTC